MEAVDYIVPEKVFQDHSPHVQPLRGLSGAKIPALYPNTSMGPSALKHQRVFLPE